MTYEEVTGHIQERYKARSGRPLPEYELDELVALVHELPCRGDTERRTAVLPTGFVEVILPCPHCTLLTYFEREKSKLRAKRNSTSSPPLR